MLHQEYYKNYPNHTPLGRLIRPHPLREPASYPLGKPLVYQYANGKHKGQRVVFPDYIVTTAGEVYRINHHRRIADICSYQHKLTRAEVMDIRSRMEWQINTYGSLNKGPKKDSLKQYWRDHYEDKITYCNLVRAARNENYLYTKGAERADLINGHQLQQPRSIKLRKEKDVFGKEYSYLFDVVTKEGYSERLTLARAVYCTYVGIPDEKLNSSHMISFKDGDWTNCSLYNLQLVHTSQVDRKVSEDAAVRSDKYTRKDLKSS